MKLSKHTLNVLKSFAEINPSIRIQRGNTILTGAVPHLIAQAEVDDIFPSEFIIYQLPEFLAAIKLLKEPEFDFQENRVKIHEGKKWINYEYADPRTVKLIKSVNDIIFTERLSFTILKDDLKELKKALSQMKLLHFRVEGSGEGVRVVGFDKEKSTQNEYIVELEGMAEKDFSVVFDSSHLKLMEGDYTVKIDENLGHFSNEDKTLQYWIATAV